MTLSNDSSLPPLLALVGPTASGKSALAMELAALGKAEIVSADSVQVYRHFDIGSGKPSTAELQQVPHHLIDELEPNAEIDASIFAKMARQRVHEISERGHLPILCGGTFLWVKALVFGLANAPPKDDAIRARHKEFVETKGRAALHLKLRQVDPPSAERLAPNDFVRVSRALEVFELTNTPMSELLQEHGFQNPRYQVTYAGVARTPESLTERIHQRIQGMFAAGWEDEVRRLMQLGFSETRPMASVGYRQVKDALERSGPLDKALLTEEITRVTRVFARRQRTWLRDESVEWILPEDTSNPSVVARLRDRALP